MIMDDIIRVLGGDVIVPHSGKVVGKEEKLKVLMVMVVVMLMVKREWQDEDVGAFG